MVIIVFPLFRVEAPMLVVMPASSVTPGCGALGSCSVEHAVKQSVVTARVRMMFLFIAVCFELILISLVATNIVHMEGKGVAK